ncbi:MAG: GAF domain-containing protein, partial [Alphaproteobacteria bacterium]|nr:GAF domain-containing protein [Alphaproteobacteria bacterium]
QQTATAEVLGVINSSPGDLAPVFNAMLDRAVRLCAATYGHFRTYDGQGFPLAAVRGEGGLVVMHHEFRHFVPGPHNPISRFLRGENIIRIADAAADAAYRADQGWRALVDTGACRSVLAIALRKEAALLGYISVYRDQVRPFSEKDIALLQNFAAQAVIAMENARLLTETREALAQQTATAEVLQVINSSPGDLPPVFDAMLERAMRLCGAEFGEFFVTEGEQLRAVAVRGAPAEFVEFRHRNPAPPTPGSITSRILAGEPVIHVADVKDDDLYRRGDPHRRALVELAGARTFVSVTLLKDRVPLGSINIYRQEIRPFSDKQIALLQNFAAQAVIAMENARLLTETREALEQQTATAEVLGVINSSPGELAPVFDAMLEKAIRVCSADAGVLLTYDGDYFTPVAHRGVAEFPRDWYPVRSHPETGSGRLAHGEDIVHIIDSASGAPVEARDPGRLAMLAMGARTQLAAALRKEGKLLGSFTIWRREVRPFSDKQIALLENFAAQAVIAMENARLLGELRQRTDEVAELNRGLEARVAEQVDELGRVGRLKRFLAPQLAELIVSQGDENILASHRREIVVVFCDLRGYTAFTETAEPEEVLDFLREYHGALGPLVSQFERTLDQFSGDGIMVFFNDPVPIPDPAERAVRMAMTMREAAGALIAYWRRRDRELGFGAGIAQGYATLGQIGFAERSGYTAIGTVCNLAARLCAEAKNGQILITGRVAAAVERVIALEDLGSLALKGLTQPVSAFNVPLAATPPALRVIEGGPQSV